MGSNVILNNNSSLHRHAFILSPQKTLPFWYGLIYLLTAIGLPPGGSSTVHIYTQTPGGSSTVHIYKQTPGGSSTVHIYTQTIHRTTQLIWEESGQCPVFASYTLAFTLQLRKKNGKISVRVARECQLARWKQNTQNRTYITLIIHKYQNKNT
jgi:hypothetical protein